MSRSLHIAICGDSLATWMCAARLLRALPDRIQLSLIAPAGSAQDNIVYGTVAPPSAYRFFQSCGLFEPDLLLRTNTALSFGTGYRNWGGTSRSWTQCYHLPFPVWDGVPFAQFIGPDGDGLAPYLINAQAAQAGRFAHPPEDPDHPLSRAEYGYQFDPDVLSALFRSVVQRENVRVHSDHIETVERNADRISALTLSNGQNVQADFYIDGSGLLGEGDADIDTVHVLNSPIELSGPSQPVRLVRAQPYGWQAMTCLQDRALITTVYDPRQDDVARAAHADPNARSVALPLNPKRKAWSGNVVSIGQVAAGLEPLTPAPYILLQRDIERLLTLIPTGSNMRVEAREYNRGQAEDVDHAALFNAAFFACPDLPDGTYWQSRTDRPVPDKLARKISQFERRAGIVMFDHEPFNAQDWAILHYGMGCRPSLDNPFAAHQDQVAIGARLDRMRQDITAIVRKMPPHAVYMEKLRSYLMNKQGQGGG